MSARKQFKALRSSLIALAFLWSASTAAFAQQRTRPTKAEKPTTEQKDNPVADPKAIITSGSVRFTVLTSQLIRIEWSENSQFEDHASFVFINRRLPVPRFQHEWENGWLVLRNDELVLRYKEGSGQFTGDNLRVEFFLNGVKIDWTPGTEDKGNLKGTQVSLDGVRGSTPLRTGLLSRDGWVMWDDIKRPLLDNSDWPWALPRPARGHRLTWIFSPNGGNRMSSMITTSFWICRDSSKPISHKTPRVRRGSEPAIAMAMELVAVAFPHA